MADEIVRFLVDKFSNDLKESTAFPLKTEFLKIGRDLSAISDKLKRVNENFHLNTADMLRESIYELDDMLIECQMLAKKYAGVDNWKNYQLPLKKLQKRFSLWTIKGKIQKVNLDLDRITQPNYKLNQPGGDGVERWTSRDVNESQIFGFKKAVDEIVSNLLQVDELVKVVGIVGMGGVGKTALAQLIFEDKGVRSHFSVRLWIYVSPTCDKKVLVKRMLLNLGVEEELIESISPSGNADSSSDVGLGELLFTLYLKLFGKRYLIILDDVWESDDWYCKLVSEPPSDAGLSGRMAHGGLPKGNGSAIIFTTRLEEVAEKMTSGGDIYHLLPLDQDPKAMWSIVKTSFENADAHATSELENMKKEILEMCSGLPLAAKTVGEIMRTLIPAGNSVNTAEGALGHP